MIPERMIPEYEPCAERARAVYQAALLDSVEPMTRLDLALAAFIEALVAAGHLPDTTTPEQAARTLAAHAAAAGSPRYAEEGWRHLLGSLVDVETAYRRAADSTPADDEITRKTLAAARRRLIDHHRDLRSAPETRAVTGG